MLGMWLVATIWVSRYTYVAHGTGFSRVLNMWSSNAHLQIYHISSIASYPWLSVEHLKATELYTRKHRIAEKIDRVWGNMHRPHGQIFFSCYQSCWNWQVWHASVGNWWLDCLSLGSDKLPVDHLPRRRLSAKSGDAEPNYTGNIWNDRLVGRRKRPLGASFQVAL